MTETVLQSEGLQKREHERNLLSDICGFPGKVAQVTASCIAHCAEKSKELKWKGKDRWEMKKHRKDGGKEKDMISVRIFYVA